MYKIATRGSRLALKQSGLIQAELKDCAGIDSELMIIKTTGDLIKDVPLAQISGSGFFTKEIENALLNKQADIAIHSLKDLPIIQPAELKVTAIPKRANPSDVIVTLTKNIDDDRALNLKPGLTVGTSAIRRQSQIKSLRPDLKVKELRGNVTTRLEKVRTGEYDAVMIAYAGLLRVDLDYSDLEIRVQNLEQIVPSPAQGALAVETRTDDHQLNEKVSQIHDTETALAVQMERSLLLLCGGGCHLPLGANLSYCDDQYRLTVFWSFKLPDRELCSVTFSVATDDLEKVYELVEQAYIRIKRFEFDELQKYYKRFSIQKNILVTRSHEKTSQLSEHLKKRDVNLIAYPILKLTEQIDQNMWTKVKNNFERYEYLIFSSSNAVEIFENILKNENIDIQTFTDMTIACVGEKTAQICKQIFASNKILISPEATGAGLGNYLRTQSQSAALFPCAREADFAMQEILKSAGWEIDRLEIYATQSAEPEKLPQVDSGKLDYICFTSALTVEYTKEKIKIPEHAVIISIGPKTTRKLEASGYRVDWELPNSNLEWIWRVI